MKRTKCESKNVVGMRGTVMEEVGIERYRCTMCAGGRFGGL